MGCKLWPLDKHVDFDHQHAWDKSEAPSAPTLKPKDVKYNVKVYCQTWQLLYCWHLLKHQHPVAQIIAQDQMNPANTLPASAMLIKALMGLLRVADTGEVLGNMTERGLVCSLQTGGTGAGGDSYNVLVILCPKNPLVS